MQTERLGSLPLLTLLSLRVFLRCPLANKKMLISLRKRGPQKAPRKVPISIRLSPDVAKGLRSTGSGWQRLADEALRSWLRKNKKVAAG